jgi:glycogen operon protein
MLPFKNRLIWESVEGSDYPLGMSYNEQDDCFNFAIYSKHASSVTLLIYDGVDFVKPFYMLELRPAINKSHHIWHCCIESTKLKSAKYYSYKMDGPEPQGRLSWHNFDKEKVLLDPYTKSVFFPPGFDRKAACNAGPNDGKAPLGIIMAGKADFDWQDDLYIRHENDLIIYELHIKGFTFHDSSGVSPQLKGTYRGLVEKIPYLKELGITAVEILPVFQFDPQSNDYWGYSPLNFFSPHHEYAQSIEVRDQLIEFKYMVRELHKADIEVILDVVYNHTTENDHLGPMYCYKGIDNSTYYLINEDLNDPYFNYSGTGNTLHTKNSTVRRMILDSLLYWRKEMHIDGFRFDLASIFSRNTDGSISFEEPPVFGMIGSHPDLANARLIAEPWDAAGTLELGSRFPGIVWMQWNSLFRDQVRRFVRGDSGLAGLLATRIYGSEDLFSDSPFDAYHAYQSVNYITCHDGFTLYDLVSFNQKHNFVNGHYNLDGPAENFSWNCGKEGIEDVPADILALRKKQAKNFAVLLFISNGTPMFVAGDEFLRTQMGNNNPYNQDNETSWIDWKFLNDNDDYFNFFKKMIAFRKSHPSLCRSRFWRNDVQWYGTNTAPDFSNSSKSLAFHLAGKSENDDDIYVLINGHEEPQTFYFQVKGPWQRIIDTGLRAPNDFTEYNTEVLNSGNYVLHDRSVAVFLKRNL